MAVAMRAMQAPDGAVIAPDSGMVVLPVDVVINRRTAEPEVMNRAIMEYAAWDILNPEREQDRVAWDDGMHMPAHAYLGQGTHLFNRQGHVVAAEATRWTDPFTTDPGELVNIDDYTMDELAWIDFAHQNIPFWRMVIGDCLAEGRPITEIMFHSIVRGVKKFLATRPAREQISA